MSDLNDPRVLFAAERTLMAWSRTSLALMGFGFLIERFGLFLRALGRAGGGTGPAANAAVAVTAAATPHAGAVSGALGLLFTVMGSLLAWLSAVQHRRVLKTLRPAEIPPGYWLHLGMFANVAIGGLGLALAVYLAQYR